MELHDISILKKDTNGLYDLTSKTFTFFTTRFFEYTVLPEEDMRIDLISYGRYQSTEYADLILNVNQIINPLNVRAGDVLIIPERSTLDNFRVVPPTPPVLRPSLINTGVTNIKDPRRLQFLEDNAQLPPSVLPVETSPIQINSDNIVILPIR